MANDIDLIAESRDKSGTSHSRRMRHAGMVPAVIYGAEKETLNLAIDHNQLLRKLANESFLNSILNIKIDNKEESVLIKNVLEGGTVTPLMNEIEVSCLPKDLPEKLEVDVIDLKLDDMLYLEDIVLPEGVEIPLLTQDEPANEPIVAVRLLRIAEEEIEPEVDEEGLEEGAEGVKLEGGTVTPLMNEVEVSCLPKDLPEKLEVDVIDLKLDEMLYLEVN